MISLSTNVAKRCQRTTVEYASALLRSKTPLDTAPPALVTNIGEKCGLNEAAARQTCGARIVADVRRIDGDGQIGRQESSSEMMF